MEIQNAGDLGALIRQKRKEDGLTLPLCQDTCRLHL
jgi:hypothetical protein